MTFFPLNPNAPAATADSLGSLLGAADSISQLPPLGVGDNANANFIAELNRTINPVTGLNALDGIFDTTGFGSINEFANFIAGISPSGNTSADQVTGLINGIITNGPNPGLDAITAGIVAEGEIRNSIFAPGGINDPFLF